MTRVVSRARLLPLLLTAAALACSPLAGSPPLLGEPDPWAPPLTYYSGVSGTGSTLKQSLKEAMSDGHIQRAYGDFRFSASLHDADPDTPGNILLVYNGASVSALWDAGATWNREHVWPQSRQPGSASNSSRGNLGDPHALRPANPSVNSSRGNKPFGFAATTGAFGSLGSYYFPGDTDKGDIARSLFYSATRYENTGLTLTNDFPSGNQMGELDALVAWHFLDPPSSFERRRNHVIFSSTENPTYFTNNRNAYIDLPAAVWSVFVDNFNDSTLWVGAAPDSQGGSFVEASARALEDATPPAIPITLHRAGRDGVYFAVTTVGDAVTDQPLHNGFSGAFPIDGPAMRTIMVGVDPTVVTAPGLYSGLVTIDNLDMTTGLGVSFGALDADDEVLVSLEALAPSAASFSPDTHQDALHLDLGEIPVDQTTEILVPIYALEPVEGFSAGAALSLAEIDDPTASTTALAPSDVVPPGESADLLVSLTPSSAGPADIMIEIASADDPDLAGASDRDPLMLTIDAMFVFDCLPDLNGDGAVNAPDLAMLLANWGSAGPGDLDHDGVVRPSDLAMMLGAWGPCAPEGASAFLPTHAP